MNVIKAIVFFILSLILIGLIILFEIKKWPVGSSLAGIFLGFLLPFFYHSIQDITDITNWKISQRKLQRGNFINDKILIRISFAYLYRIKLNNEYLLIKNNRGTNKFQPVGGVYKFNQVEKEYLKNNFHIVDDNKIQLDKSSINDYRLQIFNKYLREFVTRFDKGASRETIDDLSREFKEELIDSGILNWRQIEYRYCGRHFTDLQFSEHFQTYELLLADIVELLPSPNQIDDLKQLMDNPNPSKYLFANKDLISSRGIEPSSGKYSETIADHSKKILQETEASLSIVSDVNKKFTVSIK